MTWHVFFPSQLHSTPRICSLRFFFIHFRWFNQTLNSNERKEIQLIFAFVSNNSIITSNLKRLVCGVLWTEKKYTNYYKSNLTFVRSSMLVRWKEINFDRFIEIKVFKRKNAEWKKNNINKEQRDQQQLENFTRHCFGHALKFI